MKLRPLLHMVVDRRASDIHFKVGQPPIIRCDGELLRLEYSDFGPDDCEDLLAEVLSDEEIEEFADRRELDTSYEIPGLCRFRVNLSMERGFVRAVFRLIPLDPPSFEELNLSLVIRDLCHNQRGLILVTGPTGSGKTTTQTAMVDYINANFARHVVTIEDPIEFVHRDKVGIVSQRQIGRDTNSFVDALRTVLRQDPDVILIGEMRDSETVYASITAAETGHLVLSTLHTIDAVESLNRIIDFFPPHQHRQIRSQLSSTLVGVISQRLILEKTGVGRVPAVEIMVANQTIRDLIWKGADFYKIYEMMRQGKEQYGMQTFDQSLFDLWKENHITKENALRYATSPKDLSLKMRGFQSGGA